jgi:hypothetical protein
LRICRHAHAFDKAVIRNGGRSHFFKSDLLGFVLVWHVLHGWPFPIAGVASAFGAGKEIIARARKIAVPIIPPTAPSVIVPTDGMFVLQNFEHCNRQRSEEFRQWQRACLAIGL